MNATAKNADTKISQTTVAVLLGVSKQTLIAWAHRGWLTKPEKRGRCVYYSLDQLRRDIETNHLDCNQI